MQQITDTLGSFADKAGDMASNAGDSLSQLAGSDQMKKLMPYLVSGGIGAGAGALLTGKRRARKGESRMSHLGRVLTNALAAGGLAAGAHALVNKGLADTTGKGVQKGLNLDGPDEGPLAANLRAASFSPLTAGAAGVGGLLATDRMGGIGAGRADVKLHRQNFLDKMKGHGNDINESDVVSKPTKELDRLVRGPGYKEQEVASGKFNKRDEPIMKKVREPYTKDADMLAELERLRQRGGVAGGDTKLKRILSNVSRKGLSTFGQTTPRRAGRGILGLTAAAIPSILGSLLTKDKSQEDA